MQDNVILSDKTGRFYNLDEIKPFYASHAYPSGCDSYLYHESIRLWQVEKDLYVMAFYNEGRRGGWFTVEGNGPATYQKTHYIRFAEKNEVFSRLADLLSGHQARDLLEKSAAKFEKIK